MRTTTRPSFPTRLRTFPSMSQPRYTSGFLKHIHVYCTLYIPYNSAHGKCCFFSFSGTSSMWRRLRWRSAWRQPFLSFGRFSALPSFIFSSIFSSFLSQDERVTVKPQALNRQVAFESPRWEKVLPHFFRRGFAVLHPDLASQLWLPDVIIDKVIVAILLLIFVIFSLGIVVLVFREVKVKVLL